MTIHAEAGADARPAEMVDVADRLDDTADANLESEVAAAVALFNGRDFTGWNTYLGPPYGAQDAIGLNRDPMGVFSVVTIDGAPAIRISGETWGSLSTTEEYGDYHLRVEYKWGTHAVWPPLMTRDSGLMYHSVGPQGAVERGGGSLAQRPLGGYFMTSLELQISAGDVGSCYSLGPIVFDGGAVAKTAASQTENVGAWNQLDIFVVGNESVHVVNGVPAVHIQGAMLVADDGGTTPLTRGRIQLESESTEIFFRDVTLAQIDRIPPEFL